MKKSTRFWALVAVCGGFIVLAGAANQSAMKPMKYEVTKKVTPTNPQGMLKGSYTEITKVWLKSQNVMRMETVSSQTASATGGGKVVMIMDGKSLYVVNEARKTVAKMPQQVFSSLAKSGFGTFDPTLLPKGMTDLEKKSFKKSGVAKIGNDSCDIYKGTVNAKGGAINMAVNITMWLRQSDHFPLKFESKSNIINTTAEYKNIEYNPSMPDTLFKVPTGYKVEDMSDVFLKAKGKAQAAGCMSNMRQLGIAALMYTQDHDQKLPDPKQFKQQLMPYLKNAQVFRCPVVSGAEPHYAMNPRCKGKLSDMKEPANTILFFECDAKGQPAYRHEGQINLCFVDGHVKRFAKDKVTSGMWTPKKGD